MATWKKVNSIQEYIVSVASEIENVNKIVLGEMAEDIKNMLYIYTQNWYDAKEPVAYDRTYEFINSLTVRLVSNDEVEVGFDADKMSLGYNNGWNQHEDRFYPLSEIIDEGWDYRSDGSGALKNTIEYLESQAFLSEVRATFKKYGYNIA